MRVRFAPSPTGSLHVGGLRTALYNWLLARASGGTFVLRIEDTDAERSHEALVDGILRGLTWAGLDWDEGPYRQSERGELYRARLAELEAAGALYRDYTTPEELAADRAAADAAKRPFVYHPPADRLGANPEGRTAHVLRFRVPDGGETVVDDLLHGPVAFPNDTMGDFVVARADGSPLYHFTVAVDDAEMAITDVIRGDDHLSNAPKHVLLFGALGHPVPNFAHLSLIHGADGKKLSKRHGAADVDEFRRLGYLPEAVVNLLALLGWSLDDETQVLDLDTLVGAFSLDRVGTSAARFDYDRLGWLNGQLIREMDPDAFADRLIAWDQAEGDRADPDRLRAVAPLVQPKVRVLAEVPALTRFYTDPDRFAIEPDALARLLADPNAPAVLAAVARDDGLPGADAWTVDAVEAALRADAERLGLKLGKLLTPLRIAVIGRPVGPGMWESIHLLGREPTRRRVADALAQVPAPEAVDGA